MKIINYNFNNNETHTGAEIGISGNNAKIKNCKFKNNADNGEPESSSVESKTCDTILSNAKFVDNKN